MSGEDDKAGFLSRWSRRKREAVEAPPAEPAAAAAADAPAEPLAPAVPEPTEAEAGTAPTRHHAACPIPEVPEVDPATLPPIEELTAESDFSVFLKPGVPGLLRNAALRRMWSLDPAIRDYIGPVDYQWDFNTPGGLPFGFANELGGDVTKLLAQAIGKLEELAEEEKGAESPPDPPAEEEPPAGTLLVEAPPAELPPPEPIVVAAPPAPEALPEPGPVPRRRHGGALPA